MALQKHDTILFKNEQRLIYSQPLTKYFETLPQKPVFVSSNPLLISRGYYAELTLENNKLYLADFIGEQLLSNWTEIKLNIKDLFPTEAPPIFAGWFTGQIIMPIEKDTAANFYSPNERCLSLKFDEGVWIGEVELNRDDLMAD